MDQVYLKDIIVGHSGFKRGVGFKIIPETDMLTPVFVLSVGARLVDLMFDIDVPMILINFYSSKFMIYHVVFSLFCQFQHLFCFQNCV